MKKSAVPHALSVGYHSPAGNTREVPTKLATVPGVRKTLPPKNL